MNRLSHILIIALLSLLPASSFGQHMVMENIVGDGTDYFVAGKSLSSGIKAPSVIDVDSKGNYYFSGGLDKFLYKYNKSDSTISKILADSVITGITIDKNDFLYYCLNSDFGRGYTLNKMDLEDYSITIVAGNGIDGYPEDGVLATETPIRNAVDVVLDPQQENLYYISFSDNTIRRIHLESGYTYLVAGVPPGLIEDEDIADGTAPRAANLKLSSGLLVDRGGRIYFTHNQSMIKVIELDGLIYHFLGTTEIGYSGDGGPAATAQFNGAQTKYIFDSAGNIIISDHGNYRIRKIDMETKIITTIAGTGNSPSDDEEDPGYLNNGEFLPLLDVDIRPVGLVYNQFDELIFCDTELKIRRMFTCKNPDKPVATNPYKACKGDELTFEIDADLNDANEWSWYKEGCLVGEKIGTTSKITFTAEGDASYFVVGTGGCANSEECTEFIVENQCLEYYNTFTPNGDGINDYFDIPLLENYPENEVVFYNRWGDQLETIKNYDNSTVYWSGTNGGGDKLAAGTYFFTATSGSEKIASGWIQIILD